VLGGAALLGAAAALAAYGYALRPARLAEVEALEARAAARERELVALRTTIDHLAEFQREVHALDERMAVLDAMRPPKPDLEPLLARLTTLGHECGLTDVVVEALPAPTSGPELPMRLRGRGVPKAVSLLLARIPRLARMVREEEVELVRKEDATFEVVARLVAFQDDAPRQVSARDGSAPP
jgi:Tfp pilus assembly protein PilO